MTLKDLLQQLDRKLNLNPADKKYFLENLSLLIGSGISILPALQSIEKEVKSRPMRNMIKEMIRKIDGGANLSKALADTELFPGYVVSLIDIGEKSGSLATNLKVIVERQDRESNFRSKMTTALLYPSIILSLTSALAIFITWFILPRLTEVFNGLNVDPPLITRIFIQIGEFLGEHGNTAIPVFLVALLTILYIIFGYSKTKFIGEELLLRFPGVKKLVIEVEVSRFSFILGTLLDAGLPIESALKSLAEVKTMQRFSKLYQQLAYDIPKGESFSESFANMKNLERIIPGPIQQMIVSAEQSAELSAVLLKIGEIYEGRLDNTSKNLAVMLEPILLVVVWLGVLLIAVAIILPIYSLVGNLDAY
ncbi:hypothetical protein GF389_04790 [Candidatus Dojkabacteria bacterium]|nr:hypothetical protein [Candidatus Dojkabacteria bacterium]